MASPATELSGAEIAKHAKLASGTLYPILMRLEEAGWLKSRWEAGDPTLLGRPRRRLYRITAKGVKNVGQVSSGFDADYGELGMEVIWIVAIAILGVVGAAISRQMTDEFKAWMPWLISFIIDRAVRMLPESQRERFAEEWRSHVIEIPGDAGKLIVALGFFVASSKRAGIPAAAGKRIIDIIFSGAAIVALAPLLVVLALLYIKLDSTGSRSFGACSYWSEWQAISRNKFSHDVA